jgi:hypothetical protein
MDGIHEAAEKISLNGLSSDHSNEWSVSCGNSMPPNNTSGNFEQHHLKERLTTFTPFIKRFFQK